jgi:hypothetical protein
MLAMLACSQSSASGGSGRPNEVPADRDERAASACNGVALPAYSGPVVVMNGGNDARALASVMCTATSAGSDLRIEIEQTAFESGLFVARVQQTKPVSVAHTFCVLPSFSGHFFNFNDPASFGHLDGFVPFHLRARGIFAPEGDGDGDDNVQVDWSPSGGGAVDDSPIHCAAVSN